MFPAENTVHIELLFNLKNSCDDVGHRFVQEFRLNEQSVIYIIVSHEIASLNRFKCDIIKALCGMHPNSMAFPSSD